MKYASQVVLVCSEDTLLSTLQARKAIQFGTQITKLFLRTNEDSETSNSIVVEMEFHLEAVTQVFLLSLLLCVHTPDAAHSPEFCIQCFVLDQHLIFDYGFTDGCLQFSHCNMA